MIQVYAMFKEGGWNTEMGKKKNGVKDRRNRDVDNAEMKNPYSVYFYYNDISRLLTCNGVTKYLDTFFSIRYFVFYYIV